MRNSRGQNNPASASDLASRHRRATAGRAGARSGGGTGRRNSGGRGASASEAIRASLFRTLRSVFAFLFAVAVVAGAGYAYREFAGSDYFALRNVELRGDLRASRRELISSLESGASDGLWRADLDDLRERLRRHPWVRDAEVVRVLPDTLRVTISEREPYAMARLQRGALVWVDRDGVILDEQGAFKGAAEVDKGLPLIGGLLESDDAQSRDANRRMMLVYERLIEELRQGEPPLLGEVEEVRFDEAEGVHIHIARRRVYVIAASEDFHSQVKKALALLDAVARRDTTAIELFRISDAEKLFGSRPIRYINSKSPGRVIVGFAQ
ncbi:MAG: FtsQ-type POTRA domain-containing protein [Acidobacteria bacterium]|nr:FtsQ-type POTRA domain-containing protein [Acidobacteriota bacterium]